MGVLPPAMEPLITLLAVLLSCVVGRSSQSEKPGMLLDKRSLPGMAEFCKIRKDGQLYPDPVDCRAYIYCSGGYAYRALCGKGLYYDKQAQMCDYDYGSCSGKYAGGSGVEGGARSSHTDHASQRTFPTTRRPDPGRRRPSNPGTGTSTQLPPFFKEATSPARQHDLLHTQPTGPFDSEQFCLGQEDGQYVHPGDCHSYILCSNHYAFSLTCPSGLAFNPAGTPGCDYDHTGHCDTEGSAASVEGHRNDIERPLSHLAPAFVQDDTFFSLKIPHAIEQAMNALMRQLEREADLANSIRGRNRPFRMVQKFLKAQPIAKQLSLPAFIITNASSIVLQELGGTEGGGLSKLSRIGSPLSANAWKLRADDPSPQPEPGACPWPQYVCEPSSSYRSIDGSCNNLQHPLWGRSFTPLTRFIQPSYGDGIQSLRRARDGGELPNAREVSFSINEDRDVPTHLHTVFLLQWGQFMDHDMTLTAISKIPLQPSGMGDTVDIECGTDGCSTQLSACQPVEIPPNDPDFPLSKKCLEFVRSQGVPNLDCTLGPRQQLNQLTSYLDGSNIYGSTKEELDKLRDFQQPNRGRLRSMQHPSGRGYHHLLPTTTEDKECNEFQTSHCFLAGDGRVNEHNGLTAMHTLWMRQHNRIEAGLHAVNPHWQGERLFQETRKIVGAQIQRIMFAEFLPVVLAPTVLDKYKLRLVKSGFYDGYSPRVDASIASGFASAAYRFGHTFLVPKWTYKSKTGDKLGEKHLSELFFRPAQMLDESVGGIDGLVRGMCTNKVQSVDRFITKEVSKKLFTENPPHGLGLDLISLNIQRGRDHGIPGYMAWREWCGLSTASTFDDLTDLDFSVRMTLKRLYRHVDDIDLFPVGVAEKAVPGGLLGPTFSCIIGRQMGNLRKGDRFWHENRAPTGFTLDQLEEIRKTKLSRVVCANSDSIDQIQPNIFELPFRTAYPDEHYTGDADGLPAEWFKRLWQDDHNQRVNCSCLPDIDFQKWRE